jgi:hypothetical protein
MPSLYILHSPEVRCIDFASLLGCVTFRGSEFIQSLVPGNLSFERLHNNSQEELSSMELRVKIVHLCLHLYHVNHKIQLIIY